MSDLKTLGDFTITSDDTQIGTTVLNLDGYNAVTLQARFAYGSGGTSVAAYIQMSFDQGTTWMDVAAFGFTTASETKLVNLSGLNTSSSVVEPTDGTLTLNSAIDGFLGTQARAKVVSVGTYATNTLLSLRAVFR